MDISNALMELERSTKEWRQHQHAPNKSVYVINAYSAFNRAYQLSKNYPAIQPILNEAKAEELSDFLAALEECLKKIITHSMIKCSNCGRCFFPKKLKKTDTNHFCNATCRRDYNRQKL